MAPSTHKPAPRYLTIGGALVFLAAMTTLVLISRSVNAPILPYVAALVLGGAMVSVALWRSGPISGWIVLLVAAIGHGLALFGYAPYEDDYFRFIWDGWRLVETGTPYGIPPENFFDDLSVPAPLQDVLEWMNYPEHPTIYGPTLQGLFGLNYLVSGTNELGLRLLFASATLGLIALLLRQHPPQRVALFAWNPLVVAETTLHIHPDIILAFFLSAALLAGRRYAALAGLFLGLAAATKLVALAAFPLLFRLRPIALVTALTTLAVTYGIFAIQGLGAGFDSTETFAASWYFNPFAFQALVLTLGGGWGRIAALLIAGAIVIWLHASARDLKSLPLAEIFGIILLFAPAVNAWYLLWLLPFAIGRDRIWPYVASAVLPLSYLTGLHLGDYSLEEFAVHPIAQNVEWAAIGLALVFDIWRGLGRKHDSSAPSTPVETPQVSVIIPALNEEDCVGTAVRGIKSAAPNGICEVIVADNGSTDRTALEAMNAGALVVSEPERGYGAACLAAIAKLDPKTNIILFMDADLADAPEDAHALIAPLIDGRADMVIGSRTLGTIESGAMSAPQRFGNWLAPALVRFIWGVHYSDLGPFRAIRRDALERLAMADRDFGWTIEMQVRAAKMDMRICERPVLYRRRVGTSKISGTVRGVILAGWKILYVIAREAFGDFDKGTSRARPGTSRKNQPVTKQPHQANTP